MKQSAAFILFCLLSALGAKAQAPVPNFTADVTSGCFPIVVKFQDLSTGNPTEWEWDLGNGSKSTLRNPATTYLRAGIYKVSLRVKNASGTATVVRDSYISVYGKPRANFRVSKRTGCTPATIQFFDSSTTAPGTTITSWKWDFGDGVTSTEKNPQYVYKAPGSYTITLIVTNDKGCTQLYTLPNYINILKGVVPSYTNNLQTVCKPPVNIKFNNTSTGPETLTYLWNFGDGKTSTQKSPNHVYTTPGTYPVSLVVKSSYGCADSLKATTSIPITQINTNFIVPPICPNTPVQFLDSSSELTVSNLWKFSDGTTDPNPSATKTYPRAGRYWVRLINTYSTCTDSITKRFEIKPNPTVRFTASKTKSCQAPLSVKFNNTTLNGFSYQWDFGDGTTSTEVSPTHVYTNYGDYNVTLTATSAAGCSNTLTQPAMIRIQKPIVGIRRVPVQGCIPYSITFRDSVQSIEPIVSYRWDLGDGTISTVKQPNHTYNTQGTYTVSLTVTTASGCTETFTQPAAVKVGTKPLVDFSFNKNNVCARESINFKDESVVADQWLWDFGDGTSSTAQNPSHQYETFGTLNVKLTAFNNGCKGNVVTKKVTIKAPVALFTFRPASCNDIFTYTFTNGSLTTGDPAAHIWRWTITNGAGYTFTHNDKDLPDHTFPALGTYTVTLYVSNGECDYEMSKTVVVAEYIPEFTADKPTGCKAHTVLFTPAADNNRLIKSYVWDFGDGTPPVASAGPISYTYANSGDYTVSLTTTNIYDCISEPVVKQNYIRVNGPVAKFSRPVDQGCSGLTTAFVDETATDGKNKIVKWTWDFGDGTQKTFTAPPFLHTYAKEARYNVKLITQDAAGCIDSISNLHTVQANAFKMDWTGPRETCPGSPSEFLSVSNTRNYSSFWDFGNGDTSYALSPMYAYPDTGTYTVKLVITDTLGCKDSLTKPNYTRVYRPVASFDANNLISYCTPFEARFTNTSTFYNSSAWDLGIGTSTQTNPVSYYTSTGSYDIKLQITSPGGCTDSVTKKLQVFDANDGKLTYGPTTFSCRPLTVNFTAFSDLKASFIWDFGDGTVIDTTVNTISHTYDNIGDFVPSIILIEGSGCVVAKTGTAPIQIVGAKIKFSVDKHFFCDSGLVTIIDSTVARGPGLNYTWDFGDGTISNDPNPGSHLYNKPGVFPLKLTVKTDNGCVDTMSVQSSIKVSLTPAIRISGDSIICVNEIVESKGILDKGEPADVRWAWRFPDGTTSSAQAPPNLKFTTPGRFPIHTIATNADGCADTALKNVLVHPIPTATLPSTITLMAGDQVKLEGLYSSNVMTYDWKPTAGLNCTDCPQPIAKPKFNTKYIVRYVDSNGCANTGMVQVLVICKNANVFIPNTFSPNGDGSNDVFYVRGKGLDRVKSLRIFDRWGEVVFEKKDFAVNDASVGWDGRFRGAKPKADVYVYQVEVFCENGEVIRFDGNVALIQ